MTSSDILGKPVPGWAPPERPEALDLAGRHVRLEPLGTKVHAAELFDAFRGVLSLWDYMPYGPFATAADYHDWVSAREGSADPVFLALRNLATGRAEGVQAFCGSHPKPGRSKSGTSVFPPPCNAALRRPKRWL